MLVCLSLATLSAASLAQKPNIVWFLTVSRCAGEANINTYVALTVVEIAALKNCFVMLQFHCKLFVRMTKTACLVVLSRKLTGRVQWLRQRTWWQKKEQLPNDFISTHQSAIHPDPGFYQVSSLFFCKYDHPCVIDRIVLMKTPNRVVFMRLHGCMPFDLMDIKLAS